MLLSSGINCTLARMYGLWVVHLDVVTGDRAAGLEVMGLRNYDTSRIDDQSTKRLLREPIKIILIGQRSKGEYNLYCFFLGHGQYVPLRSSTSRC